MLSLLIAGLAFSARCSRAFERLSRRRDEHEAVRMFDLSISGYGTFSIITPLNAHAKECMLSLLTTDDAQWVGDALLVESTMLTGIMSALEPYCTVQGAGGSVMPVRRAR